MVNFTIHSDSHFKIAGILYPRIYQLKIDTNSVTLVVINTRVAELEYNISQITINGDAVSEYENNIAFTNAISEIIFKKGGADGGMGSENEIFTNNVAKTTNILTTREINNETPTELELTGNSIIMDDGYEIVGNGILCRFTGIVKVTAVISNIYFRTESQDRATGQIKAAINNVLQPTGVSWYNRTLPQSQQITIVAGATLIDLFNITENEVISIYNIRRGSYGNISLDSAGSCMLLIERIR